MMEDNWSLKELLEEERDKDSWDITDKGRVAIGHVTFVDEFMSGMRTDTGFRDKISILKVLSAYGPVPMDYLPDLLMKSGSISRFRGFRGILSKQEWLQNLEYSLDFLVEEDLIERVPFDAENPWRPPEEYWSNRTRSEPQQEEKVGLIDKLLTNWYVELDKWSLRLGTSRIRANRRLRKESERPEDDDKIKDIFSNLG